MANRRITVEFLGKDVSAGSTAAKVEQKFGKLGSKLDRVGQAAGKMLVAGAVAGSVALYKLGQNAADDAEAQRKLAIALQNSTDATEAQVAGVEDYISKTSLATGISDDELRPAFQRLAQATGDVDEAQRQMAIAMDVSAGTGKSLKVVTEAMMKANNGSTAALSRLGLKTKDAEGNTLSLNDALKEMSATFKGQAAAAADSAAGKQRRLQVALDELGESIGTLVLPAMEKLADVGLAMVNWVDRNRTTVAALVVTIGTLAAALYTVSLGMRIYAASQAVATAAAWLHNSAVLKNIATNIAYYAIIGGTGVVVMAQMAAATVASTAAMLAQTVAQKVAAVATKAFAAAQWLLNAAMTANPIGLVIAAIAALVVGLVIAYKKSETFRNIVQGALRAVAAAGKWMWNSVLKPAFEGMKKGFQAVAAAGKWMWNNVLQPVFKFLVGAIATVMGGWAAMLRALSHVPGFGWAKSAADAMDKAAGKARDIADASQKIPARRDITIAYHYTGLQGEGSGPTRGRDGDTYSYARGTSYHPGGMAVIGERGPELVDLPRGARVFTAAQSRGMMGGGPVVNINIGVATDPRATAREIRRLLLAEKRLSGANLGLA